MKNDAILHTLCAADAATQLVVADAIREYPHAPLYDYPPRVEKSPEGWASTTIEAAKHYDMGRYLTALSCFYAEARPTNAMETLIDAKLRLIKHGKHTTMFWNFLGGMAENIECLS